MSGVHLIVVHTSFQLQVFLSMYDLLVDTRHLRVNVSIGIELFKDI